MNHFSEEILAKAKKMKSVEELLSLAKQNDIPLTREQAQEYYSQLTPRSGELVDEELDNVGGGCSGTRSKVKEEKMMLNFEENVIAIAKQANSAEELLALAEENNINLTEEQAKDYFAQLNSEGKELAEEELGSVSGGVPMRQPHVLLPNETSTSSSISS